MRYNNAIDFSALRLEKARLDQSQDIADLVNLTYRGKTGWTTEAHIIQGDRTHRQKIETALSNSYAHFLVIYQAQMLVSSIYVVKEDEHAYFGFFSVHPTWQGKGVGKYVLEQTEAFALRNMGIHKFVMFVVSQRPELIAFYERRGYSRTGRIEAYPLYLGIGIPRIADLTIEYLEKVI